MVSYWPSAVNTMRAPASRGVDPWIVATVTNIAGVALSCKFLSAASHLVMNSPYKVDGSYCAYCVTCAALTASIASRIASLVAGARNGGLTRCSPTADTASRIARNTENGSSSGGSPVALERWMVSETLLFLNKCVRKSVGQSDTAGILYVDGACVISLPSLFHHSSSVVSQPIP